MSNSQTDAIIGSKTDVLEPDFDTLAKTVASTRALIAHLRKTHAPAALLAEVGREIEALNARLAEYDYPGPYAQSHFALPKEVREMPTTDDPVELFPYSPIIGPLNPISPLIDFKVRDRENHALHTFDAPYTGPPASVHGGIIALVFDELLGSLGAILGIGGFTGTLKVIYRALTPIGKPIRMRAWIDREEGVKIFIKGTMHIEGSDDGTGQPILCSETEGIFIRPKVSILADAIKKS